MAGRNALPKNIHILKGTGKKNPARMKLRENEPENKNPIGKPSKYLNALERKFFKEIISLSIDGVLGEADRIAVEQAAKILVKCRDQYFINGELIIASAAEQNQLFKYLGQFGMMPADRAKISIPKAKVKSAFDD